MGLADQKLPRQRQSFRTRDAEEARAYLRTQGFTLAIPAHEAPFTDTVLDGVSLPGLYLGYLQYGAACEICADSTRDDFRILPPIRGGLAAITGKDEVSCVPGGALLTSPSLTKVVRSPRESGWLNIFLRGPTLRRHLAGLLGEPAMVPLHFAPTIALGEGYGRSLVHYATTMLTDLRRARPLMTAIDAGLFEQFIMVGLLLSHPSNYSERLQRAAREIAPRDLRRAIDYIHANLDQPITLTDIVVASGVAGRTLQDHFRRFRDTTPMRYLRNARLDRAREALRCAEPEEGVTPIAIELGFGHLGRFAAEYRKRFGEAPSQTLVKKRRPAGRRAATAGRTVEPE
jgi:AraC-like DNA-binding protein